MRKNVILGLLCALCFVMVFMVQSRAQTSTEMQVDVLILDFSRAVNTETGEPELLIAPTRFKVGPKTPAECQSDISGFSAEVLGPRTIAFLECEIVSTEAPEPIPSVGEVKVCVPFTAVAGKTLAEYHAECLAQP